MARRNVLRRGKGHYVVRDRNGRFKSWHSRGRSGAIDRRLKVGDTRIPRTKFGRRKSGYGHMGDYKKKLVYSRKTRRFKVSRL